MSNVVLVFACGGVLCFISSVGHSEAEHEKVRISAKNELLSKIF